MHETELNTWLSQLLPLNSKIKIVDIGASPLGGQPPYKRLLDYDLADLVGFEPNPEQFQKLENMQQEGRKFYPYAIGDGTELNLNITHHRGFTSTLLPEQKTHSKIENFEQATRIVNRINTQTVRLDEIDEIDRIDLLKIDIQGGEMAVLENGRMKLADTLFVHTETAFIPLYIEQPLFSDQDRFFRDMGMLLYGFYSMNKYLPHTGREAGRSYPRSQDIGQLLDADAVFMKDFRNLELLDSEKLIRVALIAHFVYSALALTTTCLHHLETRGEIAAGAENTYWNSAVSGENPH